MPKSRAGRRILATLLGGAAALAGTMGPANAGRWVPGGTYDIARGVAVSFLRFLAEDGEGQMTIRCDAIDGLTVDVGVAGGGALPAGIAAGADVGVTLSFVGATSGEVTVAGPVLVRQDGAVMVTLAGEAATAVAGLLLQGSDRLDITIEGTTRPVPMTAVSTTIGAFAEHCAGWPR